MHFLFAMTVQGHGVCSLTEIFFSLIFFSSRCMMIMTWGRSSWTRPRCYPPRSSLKTFLKNSLLMWYMSFYCQQAVFLSFFLKLWHTRTFITFLYLKNHIIYTMFLMLFLFFSYFPGPWNRSFGHQLFVGLFNLCTLRPLQWNHWGAAVWHAAWDGRL